MRVRVQTDYEKFLMDPSSAQLNGLARVASNPWELVTPFCKPLWSVIAFYAHAKGDTVGGGGVGLRTSTASDHFVDDLGGESVDDKPCGVLGQAMQYCRRASLSLMAVKYRADADCLLGTSFPTHSKSHVMYLSHEACVAFGLETQVDMGLASAPAATWSLSYGSDNGCVGKMHTMPYGSDVASRVGWMQGAVASCGSLSGVHADHVVKDCHGTSHPARVTVYVPALRDTGAVVELSVGPVRLRAPFDPKYGFYAVSLPLTFLPAVRFHLRGLASAVAWFEVSSYQKTFGALQGEQRIDHALPAVLFSQPLHHASDCTRTPYGMPMHGIVWATHAQAVLEFNNLFYFSMGHVLIVSTSGLAFNVLVPGRRGGTVSHFAAYTSDQSVIDSQYYKQCLASRICDVVSDDLSYDAIANLLAMCCFRPFPKCVGATVHTIEAGAYLKYATRFDGMFDPATVSASHRILAGAVISVTN